MGKSFLQRGVQGAGTISPLTGTDSREIRILRTFKEETERDTFYNSKLFREMKKLNANMEFAYFPGTHEYKKAEMPFLEKKYLEWSKEH